jgi:uncharacterized protein (TIGR04141 family)
LAKQKQRLSWFLVKPRIDVDDPTTIIDSKDGLASFKIPALSKEHDSLFVRSSHPSPPRWLGYVQGHIEGDGLPAILGASSSGVLLIEAEKRLLAIAFGYGRHLIRQEAVVQDFGSNLR